MKVRIVVAIAVFGYSVCKFGGNLSPVAVFVWELHARRKEGTLCIFIFLCGFGYCYVWVVMMMMMLVVWCVWKQPWMYMLCLLRLCRIGDEWGDRVRGFSLKVMIVVAISVFECSVCKLGGKHSPVWSFVFVWELNARGKRGNNNRLKDGSVVEPLSRSIQCKATLDFFTKSRPLL